MFFGVSIILLGLYSGIVTAYFWKKDLEYAVQVVKLRRLLYLLVFAETGVGLLLGEIRFADWKTMLTVLAAGIVIDLSVLQTVSITKFWNAEFKNDTVRETLLANEKHMTLVDDKSAMLAQIAQDAEEYLTDQSIPQDTDEYMSSLDGFLSQYTKPFGFTVEYTVFSESDEEAMKDFKRMLFWLDVRYALSLSETFKDRLVRKLLEGTASLIATDLETIPIYGSLGNFAVTIKAKHDNLQKFDAHAIIILSNIFNTWYTYRTDSMI